ncbi:MAG: menaquinone-dependent protoporphyrinogen IX dehydrogenase [Gammaproteobacteria bacterium]|nr:menaquinone-dependent protoporphyrinogen IX dehydrogenase [Gammaproteobacteria bacterium]
MARILLLYNGVYGQSLKISEFVRQEIETQGHAGTVRALTDGAPDAAGFDAIVIGASIRHGKHNPAVAEFIHANRPQLESKPSAFFSVSLVARKPKKNTPETNPYVRAFLAKSPWKPKLVGVFGGVLDYQRYGLFDRYVIRLIMKINGGPTDLHEAVEFTNWDEVKRFAARLATMVAESQSAGVAGGGG